MVGPFQGRGLLIDRVPDLVLLRYALPN
jgi:hypothetical protein